MPSEFYNFLFEKVEAIAFLQANILFVPFDYSRWKERIFEKIVFSIKANLIIVSK